MAECEFGNDKKARNCANWDRSVSIVLHESLLDSKRGNALKTSEVASMVGIAGIRRPASEIRLVGKQSASVAIIHVMPRRHLSV